MLYEKTQIENNAGSIDNWLSPIDFSEIYPRLLKYFSINTVPIIYV